MIKRTYEGFLITTGTLKLAILVTTVVAGMMTGIIAAVRFFDRTANTPTRTEFVQHTRLDDSVHEQIRMHNAFVDSTLAEQSRNTHGLVCFVYHNPQPFCADRMGYPTRRLP